MTFDDVDFVEVDEDEGTFTVTKENGRAYTYNIDDEYSFFKRIMGYSDFFDVYSVEAERQNVVYEKRYRRGFESEDPYDWGQ